MLLPEVWDRSGYPTVGTGLVEGTSHKSGTGRGTLPEVRDRSGDPLRFGTGRGTLQEV